MTALVPLFVVKGTAKEGGAEKFWTGKMNGRWPEYLRNRDRAYALPEGAAEAAALAFNGTTQEFLWVIEPLNPAK